MKFVIDTEKIPNQVKIGGRSVKVIYPYTFKERSDLYFLSGQVNYFLGTIFIAQDDCGGDRYPNEAIFTTFLHELIQYICHVFNGEELLKEQEVCALSQGIHQVLVDNFKVRQ